jgi:hypothetical protein
MIYECEIDEAFRDYRECIAISDGKVRCCETSIVIPEGFPYALCQGTMDTVVYDDVNEVGELVEVYTDPAKIKWDSYPQALEVWRWARNLNHRGIACFCFEGIEDELGEVWLDGDEEKFLYLSFAALKKRLRARYAEGKQPRLHRTERESLEAGGFVDKLPFTTRQPLGGPTPSNSATT